MLRWIRWYLLPGLPDLQPCWLIGIIVDFCSFRLSESNNASTQLFRSECQWFIVPPKHDCTCPNKFPCNRMIQYFWCQVGSVVRPSANAFTVRAKWRVAARLESYLMLQQLSFFFLHHIPRRVKRYFCADRTWRKRRQAAAGQRPLLSDANLPKAFPVQVAKPVRTRRRNPEWICR